MVQRLRRECWAWLSQPGSLAGGVRASLLAYRPRLRTPTTSGLGTSSTTPRCGEASCSCLLCVCKEEVATEAVHALSAAVCNQFRQVIPSASSMRSTTCRSRSASPPETSAVAQPVNWMRSISLRTFAHGMLPSKISQFFFRSVW